MTNEDTPDDDDDATEYEAHLQRGRDLREDEDYEY
jgi:hypothetical protein